MDLQTDPFLRRAAAASMVLLESAFPWSASSTSVRRVACDARARQSDPGADRITP